MPSPTEKALRQVLNELKAQRKGLEKLVSQIETLTADISDLRIAVERRHDQIDVRVKRIESTLKLHPA